jgi:hypothetical protein
VSPHLPGLRRRIYLGYGAEFENTPLPCPRSCYDPQPQKAGATGLHNSSTHREPSDDGSSDEARKFYIALQEKFTYAASEHTSAEIILDRADATKDKMGLSTCAGGVPTKQEVTTAKNYLRENELPYLQLVADAFLVFVEGKAMKGKQLTMAELLVKMDNEMPVFARYTGPFLKPKADAHAKRQLELFQARQGGENLARATTPRALPGR